MLTPKVVPVPEGLASGMYIGSPEGDLGDMPQTTILETIEGAWWVSCSSFVFRLSSFLSFPLSLSLSHRR